MKANIQLAQLTAESLTPSCVYECMGIEPCIQRDGVKVRGHKLAECCLHGQLNLVAALHGQWVDSGKDYYAGAHLTFWFQRK